MQQIQNNFHAQGFVKDNAPTMSLLTYKFNVSFCFKK